LIERLEHGARWLFEIDEERRRLADLVAQGDDARESHEDDAASKAA